MIQPFTAADVDTERLAEVLRDLADDIEEHGVGVKKMQTYSEGEAGDYLRFGLGMEFSVSVGTRTLGNLAHEYQERDEPRTIR